MCLIACRKEYDPADLKSYRYMDIEQSTTLASLTSKLANLSGEGGLETYPTQVNDFHSSTNSSDVRHGRNTQSSSSSIASIAESLARIESKMEDLMGTSMSRHGSQAESVDSSSSAGLSFFSEHDEDSMSSVHQHRNTRASDNQTRWSDWK